LASSATAHFRSTGHPVIQSYDPREDWWYCYLDDLVFQNNGAPSSRILVVETTKGGRHGIPRRIRAHCSGRSARVGGRRTGECRSEGRGEARGQKAPDPRLEVGRGQRHRSLPSREQV